MAERLYPYSTEQPIDNPFIGHAKQLLDTLLKTKFFDKRYDAEIKKLHTPEEIADFLRRMSQLFEASNIDKAFIQVDVSAIASCVMDFTIYAVSPNVDALEHNRQIRGTLPEGYDSTLETASKVKGINVFSEFAVIFVSSTKESPYYRDFSNFNNRYPHQSTARNGDAITFSSATVQFYPLTES